MINCGSIILFGSVFQWEKASLARTRLCVRVASDPPYQISSEGERLLMQEVSGSSPLFGKLLLMLGEAAHSNNLILINSWYNIRLE